MSKHSSTRPANASKARPEGPRNDRHSGVLPAVGTRYTPNFEVDWRWNYATASGGRRMRMASETPAVLPAAIEDDQLYSARQLQRLFVTTLAAALAMIALLVGIGLSPVSGYEADDSPPTFEVADSP